MGFKCYSAGEETAEERKRREESNAKFHKEQQQKKADEKEKILSVEAVNDTDNIGILTKHGWMLLYKSSDLRPMGKTAG